jgi:hypothetical protein
VLTDAGEPAREAPAMGRDRADRDVALGRAFVALTDTAVTGYDVIELLDRLIGFLLELLSADDAAVVLEDTPRELRVVAASGDAATRTAQLQLQVREGPSLDCLQSAEPVGTADLDREARRWPRFVAAVGDRGRFRGVHALPLRLRGQVIGAVNLLRRGPGALPPAEVALGQALADAAAIGVLHERRLRGAELLNDQLQSAFCSRVVIEQAKGVLSLQFSESVAASFERLRQYARSRNGKLATVAAQVVRREIGLAGFAAPQRRPDGETDRP